MAAITLFNNPYYRARHPRYNSVPVVVVVPVPVYKTFIIVCYSVTKIYFFKYIQRKNENFLKYFLYSFI